MSLVKRGNIWWDYVWIDGVRHAKSTGTGNRRKAEIIARQFRDELNDIRQRVPQQNIDMTFGALAARFIGDGMSTPYSVDRLQHLLPFFADIPARDINQSLARKYRQERCAQNPKLKPATVNRDLSVLRRVLNWGVEESILAANPLGRLRLERERRTKRPVMSVREERLLMAHAPLHLQRIIRCALDTGMRRGEILAERWEDIDFDHRILYVTHSKTPEGEMRMVPLTGRLTEMLQSFRKDRRIVFTYDNNPVKIVKTSWAASLRRAKLRHVRFHDLRHTANTRMMLAGVLQEVRREILGHTLRKSRDVNDRYTHVELAETRDAIRKLEIWLNDQEQLLEAGKGQQSPLQSPTPNSTATEGHSDEQNEPKIPAA